MSHPAFFARLGLLCVPAFLALPAAAQSIEFDFSSIGDALIQFNAANDTFGFSTDINTGANIQIGNSTDASLVGLQGFLQGTFTIGTTSTVGSGPFQLQEAPVTGNGSITIYGSGGSKLVAQVDWNSILTVGGGGALNGDENMNLSNFSVTGNNAAFNALAAGGSGIATLSFQFVPQQNLDQLTASGGTIADTTFSGSLVSVPEPGTYAAIVGAVTLMGAAAWRWSRQRRDGSSLPSLLAGS